MRLMLPLVLMLAATAVFAHVGVKDARVMAWMKGMKAMGVDTKLLVGMAKAETPFDAEAASAAVARLTDQSAQVVPLFAVEADDPKSEALPVIWSEFEDFTAKAEALEAVLEGADVASLEGLRGSIQRIGGACADCHRAYKEPD